MKIKEAIRKANLAYINYMQACDNLAIEAQKHIIWDDNVGCQYFPADGLCILATLPEDYETFGLLECVCSAKLFFESVHVGKVISPEEFKSISF